MSRACRDAAWTLRRMTAAKANNDRGIVGTGGILTSIRHRSSLRNLVSGRETLMRYGKLILAAAVAGFTMLTTLGATTAKEASAPPEATASATLAASLAQYGLDKHDPSALLAAAHIINGLKANVAKPQPTAAGTKPESYDPMMLLKTAKNYATGPNASLA